MIDTELIILPSGIECEIQELTADAEQLLTNKADVKSGKWLNKFMAKALVSYDGKPVPENNGELISLFLDMKSGDRNYLLLRIRMQSYGDEMVFNYECPKCHKTSGYSLNLRDMLDDGTLKVYDYREDVPIMVETRSGVAEVNYMTGRTEQWLASQSEFDMVRLAMAACSKFDGKVPDYKTFSKMFVKDLSKIRIASTELKGGLDPQIELDCYECESSYKVQLHQIPDFFMPMTSVVNIGA